MKSYCLVIDDDNQKEYFATQIQNVLRKDHIDLEPIYIETKNNIYMKKDHSGFDQLKIEEDCLNAIKDHNCSIVVSDYQIATDNDDFTGLDILYKISEKYPTLYKVLYSGAGIEKATKRIYQSLSGLIQHNKQEPDEDQIKSVIDQLKKKASIDELIKGKGYAESVLRYMRTSPLIMQQLFLSQLKEEYPDMSFQSCYPNFKGWKLRKIGDEIEQKTFRGGEFQQSLIAQLIAYMININEE